MKKTIAIIGGDKRMTILADMLSKEHDMMILGTEAKSITDIEKADIIIKPIPPLKDDISKQIDELAKQNNIKVIDLMQDEGLTVLNTIATAEGAIQVAMEKTEKTIQGSKVLILGFGRVGKTTAQKFAALSAEVTCAARKPEAFAWIETSGYKSIDINKMDEELHKYDIIINTVPTLILNKEKLTKIKKDCLIIDLASKPGGVDKEAVKALDINFEWALALPGKVAPLTSAEYMLKMIKGGIEQ